MKRISKIIVALLIGVVMIIGVTGCNDDTQKQLQSKIDALQTQLVELNGKLAEMEDQIRERDERIEDLEKEISSNTGTFYSLQEAYDNGWLTQEDLMSIAYYHNDGRVYNEDIMPEDYVPQTKMPEVLSDETQLKIISAIYNVEDAETVDITITEYYGTYGDCIAVKESMHYRYGGGPCIDAILSVSGIKFCISIRNPIIIWRETK